MRSADSISVLDDGSVVAQVKHDQLLGQAGNFRQMLAAQARLYR